MKGERSEGRIIPGEVIWGMNLSRSERKGPR